MTSTDPQQIEYNMSSLSQSTGSIAAENTTTTTFSNPVYELESSAAGTIDLVVSPTLSGSSGGVDDNDGNAQIPSTSRFSTVTPRSISSSNGVLSSTSFPIKSMSATNALSEGIGLSTNSLRQRPEPAFNIIGLFL